MYHIDIKKLDTQVFDKGYSQTSFAKEIGVTRNTYLSYRANPDKIPYRVLTRMIKVLCSSISEAEAIFFAL